MRTRGLILICLWVLAAVGDPSALPNDGHPMAPVFSLTDVSGKPLNLSDHKGEVILLHFWASWCGPCRNEATKFVGLVQRFHSLGLVVIGLSLDDDLESARRFSSRYRLNYPVGLGNEDIYQAYGGIFSLPTAFLIGRDGRIYAKHFGAIDSAALGFEIRQLLSQPAEREVADFRPADQPKTPEASMAASPQEFSSEIPGVDVKRLTAAQEQAFKRQLDAQQCTCGCRLTILSCRMNDLQCTFNLDAARKRMAEFAASRPR